MSAYINEIKHAGSAAARTLIELLLRKLNMVESQLSELSREELLEIMANENLDLSWIASQESVDALRKEVGDTRTLVESCIGKLDSIGPAVDPWYGYTVAPMEELEKWDYTLDTDTTVVTLNKLKDSHQDLTIYDAYTYGGKTYLTKPGGNRFLSYGNVSEIKKVDNLTMCDHIDWSNVTTLNSMFSYLGCKTITFGKSFKHNTKNVTDMTSMFRNCDLVSIDLSGFDTSNTTGFSYMFYDNRRLTRLDLTSFDTGDGQFNMSSMFRNCYTLTEILASDKFIIPTRTSMIADMFTGCGVNHVTYVG